MKNYKFSKLSKARRAGVDSRLIEISDLALELSIIDFGIPKWGGLRTARVQNLLYLSKKSKIDGFKKIGDHQKGTALDFYAYVDGKASWEREHMAMVACAFFQAASRLGYKIEWGGLWQNFEDLPHIKLIQE